MSVLELFERGEDALRPIYYRCQRMCKAETGDYYMGNLDGWEGRGLIRLDLAVRLEALCDEGWGHGRISIGFSSLEELDLKLAAMGY